MYNSDSESSESSGSNSNNSKESISIYDINFSSSSARTTDDLDINTNNTNKEILIKSGRRRKLKKRKWKLKGKGMIKLLFLVGLSFGSFLIGLIMMFFMMKINQLRKDKNDYEKSDYYSFNFYDKSVLKESSMRIKVIKEFDQNNDDDDQMLLEFSIVDEEDKKVYNFGIAEKTYMCKCIGWDGEIVDEFNVQAYTQYDALAKGGIHCLTYHQLPKVKCDNSLFS